MVSNKLLKNLRWLTTDMNADRLEITIREGKSILALCARIEELCKRLEAAKSGGTGEWQRCPVCEGRGDHARGFYDGPGPATSDGTTRVQCRLCRGVGAVSQPLAALAGEKP